MMRYALALEQTRLGLVEEIESSLTTGLEYQRGDYGTSDTTTVWSIPVNYSYRHRQYGLSVSIPFLFADSTGDEIIVSGKMGKRKRQTTTTTTTTGRSSSGIGDIVLSGTYYFPPDYQRGLSYRATGIVKLGTADESKGLGTGETDVAIEAGAFKDLDEYRMAFTLGYEINGNSSEFDYNDVLYGSIGLTKQLARKRQAGGVLYMSEALTPSGDTPVKISGFYSHPLSKTRITRVFLTKGLTDGSPDIAIGGLIQFYF
jgi:hypothetical protein